MNMDMDTKQSLVVEKRYQMPESRAAIPYRWRLNQVQAFHRDPARRPACRALRGEICGTVVEPTSHDAKSSWVSARRTMLAEVGVLKDAHRPSARPLLV